MATLLFLDGRLIDRRENVALFLAPCRKHPDPIPLDGRTKWTSGNLYFTLYRDPATGEYRGWRREPDPSEKGTDAGAFFQVRSSDGLSWETVGGPNHLGQSILYEPDDPDPRRHYKMIYQGRAFLAPNGEVEVPMDSPDFGRQVAAGREPAHGMFAASSPDGVHWEDHRPVVIEKPALPWRWWTPGSAGWAGGDNFPCVLYAPDLARYVAFFRTNIYRGPKRRERAVGRADSPDFRVWGEPTLALHACTTWQRAMGRQSLDFYQMQVWRTAQVYLGIVSVFYWQEDRTRLELAWSPDTVHWERVCPGEDLVPHGNLGEFDGGCRYAAMRSVDLGDEVRVFYGGSTGRHNADRAGDSTLCLATFRRDRFAGLAPSRWCAGTLLTQPLVLSEDRLLLNADAREGVVRYALCDESGQAIEGASEADCAPISCQDCLAAEMKWPECRGLAALRDRRLRLRLRLDRALVYAVAGFCAG